MRKGMEKLGVTIALPQAQKMCFDKKRFSSKNLARDWGLYIAKRHGCPTQYPYRCELCGNYHVSGLPKEEKQQLRASQKRSKEMTIEQRKVRLRA